jgi:hypothetical protein
MTPTQPKNKLHASLLTPAGSPAPPAICANPDIKEERALFSGAADWGP